MMCAMVAQPSFLDTSFDAGLGPDGSITSLAIQADGTILVVGSFTNFSGIPRKHIARLKADGVVDPAFTCEPGPNGEVRRVLTYPGGKAMAVGEFTEIGGLRRVRIARLNANGSVDSTFDAGEDPPRVELFVQPDGKILLAGGFFQSIGGFSVSGVARLDADGSVDTAFQPFPGSSFSQVYYLVIQPDGKVVVSGGFRKSDTSPWQYLLRLNVDGTEDVSFRAPPDLYHAYALELQADGKLLINTSSSVERLFSDGSRDPSLGLQFPYPYFFGLFSDHANRIIIYKASTYGGFSTGDLIRLQPDGARDWTFDVGLFRGIDVVTFQPDGRLVIAGSFTDVEGVPRRSIARLFDSSSQAVFHFATPSYSTSETNPTAVVQIVRGGLSNSKESVGLRTIDDRALAGSDYVGQTGRVEFAPGERFKSVAIPLINDALGAEADEEFTVTLENPGPGGLIGTPRNAIISIHDDDHLDPTFNPGAVGQIRSVALLWDGKLMISGSFTNIQGVPRAKIARLNADSSLDTTFDPGNRLNVIAFAIAPEPTGTVLIAGFFTNLAGLPRQFIARLLLDGSVDEAFVPPQTLGFTDRLALQSDGKVLTRTRSVVSLSSFSLLRLNTDGSLDTKFVPELGAISNSVTSMAIQSDGRILVGGEARTQTDRTLLRLNENGSPDPTFVSKEFTNWLPVRSLTLQRDGRILVALGRDGGDCAYMPFQRLLRLQPDGSLDPTWHTPTFSSFPPLSHMECPIFSLDVVLVRPDRRIVVAGAIMGVSGSDWINPRGLIQLNPDGSWDADFNPGSFTGPWQFPNWPIFGGGAIQPDGKLILGGLFKVGAEGDPTNLVRIPAGPLLVTTSRFAAIEPGTNGAVRITTRFEGSQYYLIEASADLGRWLPICTNTDQRLFHSFTDTMIPGSTQRFYRVRAWE